MVRCNHERISSRLRRFPVVFVGCVPAISAGEFLCYTADCVTGWPTASDGAPHACFSYQLTVDLRCAQSL
jgi:hypothetical protein